MENAIKPLAACLLLLACVLNWTTANFCPGSPTKCSCYMDFRATEIQCPREDSEVQIRVTTEENVELECTSNTGYLNMAVVPKLKASRGKKLSIRFCNINNTVNEIRERFDMTQIEKLYFEQWGQRENAPTISLTRELIAGNERLTVFSVTFSNPIIDKDLFEEMPNLRVLSFNKNGIKHINWSFDSIPDLENMDLSRNEISSLPEGIFKKLTKLRILYLWGNSISQIEKSMLEGLNNIELLELYSNNISYISEDVFSDLPKLINISLRSNKLKNIYSNTFRKNEALVNVRLGFNELLRLEKGVFANFTKLKAVELNNNQLRDIPDYLFAGSAALEEIKLQQNKIQAISSTAFEGLSSLKRLDLSYNALTTLTAPSLSSLINLNHLVLKNNSLTSITKDTFIKLTRLVTLDLSANRIQTIDLNAFDGQQEALTDLDLSYNQWDNIYSLDISPLEKCLRIVNLKLHHNRLTNVPTLLAWTQIKNLDLNNNKITDLFIDSFVHYPEIVVNVTYNEIKLVSFDRAETLIRANDPIEVSPSLALIDIRHNPILCTCSNYDLVLFNNGKMPLVENLIEIKQDELKCEDGTRLVTQLKPLDVQCQPKKCASGCTCSYRPFDRAVIVNCADRNLTTYPILDQDVVKYNYNHTVLLLSGNKLTEGPVNTLNYDNVTHLDLSSNNINKVTWIPPKIKELNLERNKIKVLDSSVVKLLNNATSLQRLMLGDNPWSCNCDALDLQKYLMQYYNKVNATDVYCDNNKVLLVKKPELCKPSLYLTVIIPLVLFILFCCAVMIALYYRYQSEIKIYLYTKNLCLWLVTEEELDKDKEFDIFISYSNEDEKFVEEHLLPELERGEYPFKVCIHFRDWIPGDPIPDQIERSVKNSRRTLVVLSNNFVNSVWGTLEFRTAHTEALSEGRARVIVVIVGDVEEEKLDQELKSYLKTNTYVKWGDRYFWNKLKYALPHSKHKLFARNRKIMLKIDDKFNLVPSSPNSSFTTPPIIIDSSNFLSGLDKKPDIPKKVETEGSRLF